MQQSPAYKKPLIEFQIQAGFLLKEISTKGCPQILFEESFMI